MQNDPELDPKFLGKISSDFIKVADLLKEAAYQMKRREISSFPIFPMSHTALPVGSPLYEKGKLGNDFHYYISFMEEFLQREIIKEEADFKNIYKDPEEFCCLFVVEEEFTNFLFIPFPED